MAHPLRLAFRLMNEPIIFLAQRRVSTVQIVHLALSGDVEESAKVYLLIAEKTLQVREPNSARSVG
jgi:hypothetical protein